MEKGFRIVICPEPCKTRLKLNITKEHYGKKLEVTCPICHLRFPVTIPVPAERVGGKAFEPIDDEDPLDVLGNLNRMFDEDLPGIHKELDKRFGRKK